MRILVLLSFLLWFMADASAQDRHKLDSLLQLVNTLPQYCGTEADTTRMKICIDIGDLYETSQPDSALWWYGSISDASVSTEKIKLFPHRATLFSTALRFQGIIFDALGNFPEAKRYYVRAMKIDEESGDKRGISVCLICLGISSYSQCNYPEAINYHERSLKIREETGDKKGISKCLNNLGVICADQGNYPDALSYYEHALKIAEELSDKSGISKLLNNLGLVCAAQGNYQEAEDYYGRAMKIIQEI
ncbi:MAG: tetratricopeptide repeat protein, partial [Bacteroidetes bacterium]|nr:tetratricopeptide repeat protein [Bacteroidota bacterium]